MSQPTPLAWPTDLEFGTLVGRFVYLDGDSDDSGDEPDLIPAAGGTVEVEANAALAAYLGAAPLTAVKRKVIGIIDAEGYLCRRTASGMPGARGLSVIATDNEQLSTQGFNYKITVKLPGATIPAMNLSVPGGTEVDLATAVTEAVSGGTKVVSLTPEIRAEIQRAMNSVSIDTTGLATEDDLTTGLATKVDQATFDTTVATLASNPGLTPAEVETIVLDNALLAEGESVTSLTVEQADGKTLLVQHTSTGREVSVEIPVVVSGGGTPAASSVEAAWDMPWEAFRTESGGGFLSRTGPVVTLFIRNPRVFDGAPFFKPAEGFRPAKSRNRDALLDSYAVGPNREVIGGAGYFYEGEVMASVPVGGIPEGQTTAKWASLTVRWLTTDPAPTGAQTTDADATKPLQVWPVASL